MSEEVEYDADYEPNDEYKNTKNLVSPRVKMTEVKETGAKGQETRPKSRSPSVIFSPVDSPRSSSSKHSSPKSDKQVPSPRPPSGLGRKDSPSMLRLLSSRVSTASLPLSPHMSNDYSTSSADSDGEVTDGEVSLLA